MRNYSVPPRCPNPRDGVKWAEDAIHRGLLLYLESRRRPTSAAQLEILPPPILPFWLPPLPNERRLQTEKLWEIVRKLNKPKSSKKMKSTQNKHHAITDHDQILSEIEAALDLYRPPLVCCSSGSRSSASSDCNSLHGVDQDEFVSVEHLDQERRANTLKKINEGLHNLMSAADNK